MDIPGFSPKREAAVQTDGSFVVYVTPPSFMQLPRVSVTLSADQYERYVQWRVHGGLIQQLLFDLSDDDREKLMSGIGDEDFQRIANEKDE